MKNTLLSGLLLLTTALSACTDASKERLSGLGKPHRVEVLAASQIVRTYTSAGEVERRRDSYYFIDAATGELVEVNGQLIITRLK